MRTLFPALVLVLLATGCRSDEEHWYLKKTPHEHHATWGYSGDTGPEHWGDLAPEYHAARDGIRQSPIDIDTAAARETALPEPIFQYHPEPAIFLNNGHTLEHEEGPGNWMTLDGRRYRLVQFHFHTPSEHTVDGEHAPLEIHLVHRAEDDDSLLVVGILAEAGGDDANVESAMAFLPREADTRDLLPTTIDPTVLLPDSREYFAYAGSLTTPPCTEGVTWVLMKERKQLPARLVTRLGAIMGENNRPTQPRHGRLVTR